MAEFEPESLQRYGTFLAPRGLVPPGYEGELVAVPIEADGLFVVKALAWRADNDNPLIPLFLEMAKR